jgi:hypothetical protein
MKDPTVWALAKAREILDCEGAALVTCVQKLQVYELEAETTLLAVAISEALLEAFSLGSEAKEQGDLERQS